MTSRLKKGMTLAMTALILASCTMTDFCGTEAPPVEDGRIARAKGWFEEEVVKTATKSSDSRKGFLNLGNIAPEWEYARCNVNRYTANENVETGLESQYRFRVIQTDPETGKTRRVKCYHKLTVLQRPGDGGHGVFVVFYIASNSYSKTHKGILSERFQEDGRLKDYTGVKVYTTIEGKVVRVNRYENGEKVCGVFIPGLRSETERINAKRLLYSMVGNMKFQIGRRIAPATKSGEDDYCWAWEELIEESVCVVERVDPPGPDDDTDDDEDDEWMYLDEEWLYYDDYYIFCDPDDCTDSLDSNTDKRNVGGIEVEGCNPTQFLNLHNTIYHEKLKNCKFVKNTLEKLNTNKVKFNIVEQAYYSVKEKNTETGDIELRQKTCDICTHRPDDDGVVVIDITARNLDIEGVGFNAIHEELLHALQYQSDPEWRTGDMEFEAKIYLSNIYLDSGLYFGMIDEYTLSFKNYFENPNDDTFEAAKKSLIECGYDSDKFPMSDMPHCDRSKHLK